MQPLIRKLELHTLHLPVVLRSRQTLAARPPAASILVRATSSDNLHGIGEGCLSDAGAGETPETAQAFLHAHQASLTENVRDLESLHAWVETHRTAIAQHPATWCAIELALLDLFARTAEISVEALLGLPQMSGTFYYTAVIDDQSTVPFPALVRHYRALGMHDFKLSLSGEIRRDREMLAILCTGKVPRLRLRARVSRPWLDVSAAMTYVDALGTPLYALEDPLADTDPQTLLKLSASLDTRIVLNDTLVSLAQLDGLAAHAGRFIVNVSLSKWGGLLRTLELVERCRARGIPVIVGALTGESSLLTRAALTLANAARDLLVAQEGAFGTLWHNQDLCEPQLSFGPGGALRPQDAALARRPGFGIQVAASAPQP